MKIIDEYTQNTNIENLLIFLITEQFSLHINVPGFQDSKFSNNQFHYT